MSQILEYILTAIVLIFAVAYSLGVFIINLIFITAPIWILALIFA